MNDERQTGNDSIRAYFSEYYDVVPELDQNWPGADIPLWWESLIDDLDDFMRTHPDYEFRRLGDFVVEVLDYDDPQLGYAERIYELDDNGNDRYLKTIHKNVVDGIFKLPARALGIDLQGGVDHCLGTWGWCPGVEFSTSVLSDSAGAGLEHVFLFENDQLPYFFQFLLESKTGPECFYLEVIRHEYQRWKNPNFSREPYQSLLEMHVPVPRGEKLHQLASTARKIGEAQLQLSDYAKMLINDPWGNQTLDEEITGLLATMGKLNAADELISLIRHGESTTLEFKESLSLDVKTGQKAKYIETSALKTVAGFLNSQGGKLLIGVRDDGTITGLRHEVEKLYRGNIDKFTLHFKNLVKEKFGGRNFPKILWNLVRVAEELVLRVDVQQSESEVFLDHDFYVRTNPATDKLVGEDLINYCRQRFPK